MRLWNRKEKYILRSCPYCKDSLFPYLSNGGALDLYYCLNRACIGYTRFFLERGVTLPQPVVEEIIVYPKQVQSGWNALWND